MGAADDVYNATVRELPAAERLRLAALILNGLADSVPVDVAPHWSDEDVREVTAFSLRTASDGE